MRKRNSLSVHNQVAVPPGSYPSEAAPLATEYRTNGYESGAEELGREDRVPVCTDSESLLTTICCNLALFTVVCIRLNQLHCLQPRRAE